MTLLNSNPIIYDVTGSKKLLQLLDFEDEECVESVSPDEVFDSIRNINDPEHPLTLEQLNVVQVNHLTVSNKENMILIQFTPTIPHCSMATLIGLCIRVKLSRSIPKRFKITIKIYPGSHQSELAVNKQLNDKERVAAALENIHLLEIVNKCIVDSDE